MPVLIVPKLYYPIPFGGRGDSVPGCFSIPVTIKTLYGNFFIGVQYDVSYSLLPQLQLNVLNPLFGTSVLVGVRFVQRKPHVGNAPPVPR